MVGGLPSFEIADWSRDWLEAFSTRRQDILDYIADTGRAYTTANAQAAALATRGAKQEPVQNELIKLWRQRAESRGLVLGSTRDRRKTSKTQSEMIFPSKEKRLSPLEAVWQAMQHLEERQSLFCRSDLLAAALGRDLGRHTHEELDAAIDRMQQDDHLVATTSGDFTTRATLRAERAVIATLQTERAEQLANVQDVITDLNTTSLTDGQKDAVRTILCSHNQVVGVQGFAGTGKTRMLKEVVRLAGDRPVIGLAPSSAAARVLSLETGISTTTLQWVLARYGF